MIFNCKSGSSPHCDCVQSITVEKVDARNKMFAVLQQSGNYLFQTSSVKRVHSLYNTIQKIISIKHATMLFAN